MDCLDENTASAFVAGSLARRARADVEEHVDVCADCLALLAAIARVSSIVTEDAGAHDDVDEGSEAPGSLRKGSRVGRYELHALVGVGAMGVVYAARDPDLDRTVALKLVRASLGRDAKGDTERLLAEARTMAKLVHPNVVAVHDVGTHQGRVFLAMDHVDGETLGAWLGREPRKTEDVIAAFSAAGRGLAAAHRAGIVHRDFKPENVLVGKDGRVLVTDFGLASAAAGPLEGAPAAIVGTPAYMAPEQLRGEPVDAAADQFSFCVALYEAIHGERPFPGDRPTDVLRAMGAGELGDITRGPAHVRRALRRGLAMSRQGRWLSMDVLVEHLAESPLAGRRRLILVAAVALGCALLGGALFVVHRREASCREAAPAKLHGVWDESRKTAIRQAFDATKLPYAADAWSRVEKALDAQANAWQAMHVDACDATRVRGEQTEELLELRVACLGDRLADMRALGDVLAHADAEVVRNGPAAVLALTPLRGCSDALALRAIERPPARSLAVLASTRDDVARVKALRDAGAMKASVALGIATAKKSQELGYAPLEAEAFLRLGDAQVGAGDGASATISLQHAAQVADLAKDDVTRARALIERLFTDGYLLRQTDRIAELDGQAEAAVGRLGGDAELEGDRLHSLGMALLAKHDLEPASASFTRARVLRERVHGPKSRWVAMTLNSLCLVAQKRGDVQEALSTCQHALELWKEVLGEHHPEVALGLNNVGGLFEQLERHAEARPCFEQSLAIAEAALGPDHPQVAMTLGNLGECQLASGEPLAALASQKRALAIREKVYGPDHPRVATTLTNLGRAYLGAGDAERAREVLERARTIQKPDTDRDERAETEFGLARALWERGPRDHERALGLANEAHADVNDTRERRAIDAWLTTHR